METNKYLTHVNALRGLAIILVFLYHLREQRCPQGFLGVDAFFVISGYFLIPALLKRSYKGGSFLWMNYYKSKITRILPPLVVMTLVTLLVAIPLMIACDLINAAGTARTVIIGLSNIYLGLVSTDYFAPGVKENIFLHTWYIAVLIQILIIAPFLCRPLSRLRPVWSYLLLVLIAVASLLIFFQHGLPQEWQDKLPALVKNGGYLGSVYYMTAGRLWEIIAGAFVALLPAAKDQRLRSFLLSLGLLLLIIPCFLPENDSRFAIAAVSGTILVIRYGEATHLTRFFENRIFMWLGTVSFSLYLIHWPIMALARYALMRDFTPLDCLWVTAFSFLLTWALYHGIEKRRLRLLLLVLLWTLTMALTFLMRRTDGLKDYVHVEANAMREYTSTEYEDWEFAPESNRNSTYPQVLNPVMGHYGDTVLMDHNPDYGRAPILQIGDNTKQPNFILLGDSYANALFPGFDIVAKREGWSGIYLNLYMTPFWGRLNQENRDTKAQFSQEKAEALLKWLERHSTLRYVIVQQRWLSRFRPATTWEGTPIESGQVWQQGENALTAFCERMRAADKEVIFFMPTPEADVPVKTLLASLMKRAHLWYHPADMQPQVRSTHEQYDERNGRIRQILTRLRDKGLCTVVDPAPALFENGVFDPVEGEELIVYDHGHMTVYGATKLINRLRRQLGSILSSGKATEQE